MSFNSNATTPEMLVKSLIKRKWTEDEKVRAIYGWIVKNIEYDITMDIFNKQLNRTELEMIMESFNKRQGTCHNYSLLFQYMCKRIGIEASYIYGRVKSPPSQIGMFPTDYHGWNMVKTNGKYHLIDVTFATARPWCFEYFFYPDPKRFIATHFPENPKDQLLSSPVKKEQFDKYPYVSDYFFSEKNDNIFPKQGTIITDNGQIRLKIVHPDSSALSPTILMDNKSVYYPAYEFKKVGQTLFLSVKIPEGEHALILGYELLVFKVIYTKAKTD